MSDAGAARTVFTIGHSNKPRERLLEALGEADVSRLVDVRALPASRRNPQFNCDALAAALAALGIEYKHAPTLGGRREPGEGSEDAGLREPGLRSFADYMASAAFGSALAELIELAATRRTAIMCAESLPQNCHRSLISDALVATGVEVVHLLDPGVVRHELSPRARVTDGVVRYPALL